MAFKYFDLSEAQNEFLSSYSPKDEHFTSSLEMKQIISKLGLDEGHDVEELRSIRNSVVRLYSNLEKKELTVTPNGPIRTEKYWSLNSSMMSVTAVIDHYMYQANPQSV